MRDGDGEGGKKRREENPRERGGKNVEPDEKAVRGSYFDSAGEWRGDINAQKRRERDG